MADAPTVAAWAEEVLLGGTLDHKLAAPPRADPRVAAWSAAPEAPGRPDALAFRTGRAFLPRRGRGLEDDGERAAALHAFANHELLALEVMALALLRFPDAPAAFRRELVATMRDEQRHLRLYLGRLDALGVPFGSLPVHGRFWRLLADMERPHDFVLRMSLTLEQANLDFAAAYQQRFAEAGDAASAAVLSRVLRDELVHVRRGVRWHARWKDPALSAFDAWTRALPPDLSPTRARGAPYRPDLRTQAGLDADFAARLGAWGWAHGRPARRWVANLDAEAVLGGSATPAARAVAATLAPLVAWLAEDGDTVEVPTPPDPTWWAACVREGAPRVHLVGPGEASPEPAPVRAAWARLDGLVEAHATPVPWLAKGAVLPLRAALREAFPTASVLGPAILDGALLRDHHDLEALREAVAGAGFDEVVVKAAFGASGHGLRRLPARGPVPAATARWLEGALADAHGAVGEPWLQRLADLSLLLDLDAGAPARVRRALVTRAGRHEGHLLGDPWPTLPAALRRWAHMADPTAPRELLDASATLVAEALAASGVRGRVGVDVLLAQGPDGPWIRPLVEVNARATLGHVALALESRIAPRTRGAFLLHRRLAPGMVEAAARCLPCAHDADGRLRAGLRILTAAQDAPVTAALWAAPSWETLACAWEALGVAPSSWDPGVVAADGSAAG
ncbi:MAG: DUF455 family protein [Alphaproteobacteria bacterium]|nr:DUF455 family protein [Alphaproteobacteria bacterium]